MAEVSNYHPIKEIARRNPAFSEPSLRWHIFNAAKNGLAESGAIVRVGRRVLIHEGRFCAWIESVGAAAGRKV